MNRPRYKATQEDMLIFHPPEVPEPCKECKDKPECYRVCKPRVPCEIRPLSVHCVDCRDCAITGQRTPWCEIRGNCRIDKQEQSDRIILIAQKEEDVLRENTFKRWAHSDNQNPEFRKWKREYMKELENRGIVLSENTNAREKILEKALKVFECP